MKELRLFLKYFIHIVHIARGVFIGLLAIIIICGLLMPLTENIPLIKSVWSAIITSITLDSRYLTPTSTFGRLLNICIALTGMLFFGLLVGIASSALQSALRDLNKSPAD